MKSDVLDTRACGRATEQSQIDNGEQWSAAVVAMVNADATPTIRNYFRGLEARAELARLQLRENELADFHKTLVGFLESDARRIRIDERIF